MFDCFTLTLSEMPLVYKFLFTTKTEMVLKKKKNYIITGLLNLCSYNYFHKTKKKKF